MEIKDNHFIVFDNNVQVGDEFYYGKIHKAKVTDILKIWSTAKNKWSDNVIYNAELITGFARNTFEVSKTTVVRNRLNRR